MAYQSDYNKVLNLLSTPVLIINMTGQVVFCNRALLALLPKASIGSSFVSLIPSVEEAVFNELLVKVKNTSYETFNVSVSREALINIQLRYINELNNDEVVLVELKTRQKINNQHFSQQIIDSIPDSIFIKDLNSKFLMANNWVVKFMKVETPQDLIGKSDFDFYPKALAQEFYDDEQEIINTRIPIINKHEKIKRNNKTYWYSTTKVPYFNVHGEVQGIIGIGRDISKLIKKNKALKKAKVAAEKADWLKSTFLANISHEIRTPLNSIIGFSQFLKQTETTKEKRHKHLDTIYKNGLQLLDLINNIIDISMIESQQVEANKQIFSANSFLEQVKENVVRLLHNTERDLKVELLIPDNDMQLYTDTMLLTQILNNLLQNAIKFTPEGKISIGYKQSNSEIEFFVRDTGVGISSSQQEDIFNNFRQADESVTRSFGGTGLGLSICKGLVELLGGKIWVKSVISEGATFYFTLPIVKSEGL